MAGAWGLVDDALVDARDDGPTRSPSLDEIPIWDLLDRLGIGVFSVDHTTGRFAVVNEAVARMTGFPSAAHMVGAPVVDHYEDPKERAEAAARIFAHPDIRTKGCVRFEAQRTRHDNGEVMDTLLSIVPTFVDGQVVRIDGLVENIGERKAAEKSFRLGSERFRVLFETTVVAMALTGAGDKLTRVNAAACRFFGAEEEELRDTSLLSLVHPDHRGEARRVLGASESSTDAWEARFLRKDGEIIWGDLSSSWLKEEGVAHSRVVIIQDVTRRKGMEALELQRLKTAAVGRLAGGLAHDFNNVLTEVVGGLDLADSTLDPDDPAHASLERVERGVRRAQQLTQRLLTFAEGGEPVKRLTPMNALLAETTELSLVGSNVEVVLQADTDLRPCEVDRGQIAQVFQNLLENAVEAMPDGGQVRVRAINTDGGPSAEATGPFIRVDVADMGRGISPEDRVKIFEPFHTTKDGRSGLGLAAVQSIVRRHGGYVRVGPTDGQRGATFSVFLPARDGPETSKTPRAGSSQRHAGARVLVMDDEPTVRDIASVILRRLGLEVTQACDGEAAAFAYADALDKGRPFDAVLLDLTVRGGLGGAPALELMRDQDPNVRAIVTSGYSNDPIMAAPLRHGFVAVLPKPFTAKQLGEVVLEVLDANH